MKKLFLVAVAVLATAFSASAQVKIQSPHPDLDIKITRCAFANGTVVIDMIVTNYGSDEKIKFWAYNGHSSAYDDDGNQYVTTNSGEVRFKMAIGNAAVDAGGVDTVFPQDVPLKFRMQLDNISLNATKFHLIKLAASSGGSMSLDRDKPILIRNLEWVK